MRCLLASGLLGVGVAMLSVAEHATTTVAVERGAGASALLVCAWLFFAELSAQR